MRNQQKFELNAEAEVVIPDGSPSAEALRRTTHLGIGAHQDDLEILAMHGILQGLNVPDAAFAGITCTDGAGSPRAGKFAHVTDAQMKEIRWEEQRQAASVGKYAAIVQLKHTSSRIKDPSNDTLTNELESLLLATCPSVLYTHNLADKHDTHIAVASSAIKALRRLPADKQPKHVYGVEIWRDLDWLPDDKKILLDVSDAEELGMALIGIYESQIAGGKRYDMATIGRWRSNATYFESHGTDSATLISYAMDLTPLIADAALSPTALVSDTINIFRNDVESKLRKHFE